MNRTARDDSGIALIIALLVLTLASTLSLAVYASTAETSRASAGDRQRNAAVGGAEAALNSTDAALTVVDPTNLPCQWPATGTDTLHESPDTSSASVAITYQDATGAAVACGAHGPGTAVQALLTATATENALAGQSAVTRRLESLVKLVPQYLPGGLNDAIYTDQSLSFNGSPNVLGSAGPNADVYANNAFTCNGSSTFQGSLYSQYAVSMNGSCSIAKDLYAKGDISINGTGSFGGDVKSSQGNISTNGSPSIAGSAEVNTGHTCGSTSKCVGGFSNPDPPQQPFPSIFWDTTAQNAWLAGGFTNIVVLTGCATNPEAWVAANGATLPADTVLVSDCQFSKNGNVTLKLNHNLAIFDFNGYSSNGSLTFTSTTTTVHQLYLIVPNNTENTENALTRPCSSPTFNTNGSITMSSTIHALVYSPCDVHYNGAQTYNGQLYSGSNLAVNGNFTLQYQQLPAYDVTYPPGGAPSSYSVDVIYEREQ